jgi:murein DD-endopeptidase MepM/ murein hydrolase activator NlpD
MRERTRTALIVAGSVAGGLVVGGGLIYGLASLLGGGYGLPPGIPEPRQVKGIPFAQGGKRPYWPVLSSSSRGDEVAYQDVYGDFHGNWARRFGAPRDDHTHVGIDLYANDGDEIVSTENGIVVGTQTFHLGTDAILVQTDSGIVVLYGEVAPWSWKKYGLQVGSRVSAGQPIARVGCMVGEPPNCESHMLHLETYVAGTTKNKRWTGGSPPPEILDPSRYLLRASQRGLSA